MAHSLRYVRRGVLTPLGNGLVSRMVMITVRGSAELLTLMVGSTASPKRKTRPLRKSSIHSRRSRTMDLTFGIAPLYSHHLWIFHIGVILY